MSLSSFQRRRRELSAKEAEEQQEEERPLEELSVSELKKVKNDDLKARLGQLGIEFESNDVKDTLIDKLKAAATDEQESDESTGDEEDQEADEVTDDIEEEGDSDEESESQES